MLISERAGRMYNKQLDVFVMAAELGSFSKAAEALFITPSAVIQQVNGLEERLGVRLFERSRRGITLTPAGSHLLTEGKELIARSNRLVSELRARGEDTQKQITLGVSLLHRSRLVYELWSKFLSVERDYRLNVINLQFTNRSASAFMQDADIIEGLDDGEMWQSRWSFLPLCRVPLACAVPKEHPLAGKQRLTMEDLKGETVITIRRGMAECLDRFADDLTSAGIDVQEASAYDLSVFSRCVLNGYVLQTPMCWHDIHPDLVTIPCDWDYALPYGLWHKNAPGAAEGFLRFVREAIADEGYAAMLIRNL